MTERRWFRNSRDPRLQGDGWRWSLSFWLPFPLDLLVLTPDQRDACFRERVAFLDSGDERVMYLAGVLAGLAGTRRYDLDDWERAVLREASQRLWPGGGP